MKKMLIHAAAAAALAGAAASAHAIVLDFEDLRGLEFFTSDYNGLRFGNNDPDTNAWFYSSEIEEDYPPSSGFTSISTDFRLYTPPPGLPRMQLQATLPISTVDLPFIFNGANFTGFDSIQYTLFLNGVEVFESTPSAPLSRTPLFVASGYALPITSVVVRGTQGFYALDDFNYVPVPEPTTTGLMLAGLGVVGLLARRRRG